MAFGSNKYRLVKTISLYFLFFYITTDLALAQAPTLTVSGKLKIEKGNLDQSKITLEKNGEIIQEKSLSGSGKFEFELDYNADYIFSFSKEGFVTKKVSFNTHIPNDVLNSKDFNPEPFNFMVSLFKQYDGVNYVVFNQPVGKIRFNGSLGEFDYDTDYTKSIQSHIQEIEDQVKQEELKEENQNNQQQADLSRQDKEMKEQERAQMIAQLKADADARKKAEEERKLADAKAKADLEAKLKADAEIRKKQEEQRRIREQQAKDSLIAANRAKEAERRQAEEAARLKAEKEKEERRLAELEQIRRTEEERKLAEEKARADLEAKIKEDAARYKKEQEEKALAEAKARAELEARLKAEADARRKLEEEQRVRQLEEQQRLIAETRRQNQIKAEEERRRQYVANQANKDLMAESFPAPNQLTYPNDKTVERYDKGNRKILRVIIRDGDKFRVYIKVEYQWGGIFYFIEDYPGYYRNVSESYFRIETTEH